MKGRGQFPGWHCVINSYLGGMPLSSSNHLLTVTPLDPSICNVKKLLLDISSADIHYVPTMCYLRQKMDSNTLNICFALQTPAQFLLKNSRATIFCVRFFPKAIYLYASIYFWYFKKQLELRRKLQKSNSRFTFCSLNNQKHKNHYSGIFFKHFLFSVLKQDTWSQHD